MRIGNRRNIYRNLLSIILQSQKVEYLIYLTNMPKISFTLMITYIKRCVCMIKWLMKYLNKIWKTEFRKKKKTVGYLKSFYSTVNVWSANRCSEDDLTGKNKNFSHPTDFHKFHLKWLHIHTHWPLKYTNECTFMQISHQPMM